jgi:hypothetical protein
MGSGKGALGVDWVVAVATGPVALPEPAAPAVG